MRCIECEEIELARVRDERPGADAADPVRGARRLPRRTHAPPTSRAAGCCSGAWPASPRSTRAKELGFEQVWESVAAAADAPSRTRLVVLYLAGGNDGLNVIVPNDTADYASYAAARPNIHRAKGATPRTPTATRRRGSARTRCPAPGGAALAFSGRHGLQDRRRRQLGQALQLHRHGRRFGFDTLFGNGTRRRRLGPGDHARGRRQAVQPQPLRQLGHLVPGVSNDVNIKTGWLGRWLERYGSRHQPAAGDLDRHGAVEVDPHDARSPCARSRRCRWAGSR